MFTYQRRTQHLRTSKSVITASALCAFAFACGGSKSEEDILRNATVNIISEGSFREPNQVNVGQASGSGFIIDKDGYIVTNNHVVAGSTIRKVFVHGDDTPKSASLVAISECTDLAVLKIDGGPYEVLEWHEGDIEPGDEVYAAGFPGVTGNGAYTLTKGIISTTPKSVDTTWAAVSGAIFHDAQINSGNSGGPLVLREKGRVVGVNYAGQSDQNAHIAISAREARGIVERLKTGEEVDSIGISGEALVVRNPQTQNQEPLGVWVSAVRAGGLADTAGIRAGDLITEIGSLPLDRAVDSKNYSLRNFCEVLRSNKPASDVITIKVYRLDSKMECAGQLNGRPLQAIDQQGNSAPCPIAAAQGPGGPQANPPASPQNPPTPPQHPPAPPQNPPTPPQNPPAPPQNPPGSIQEIEPNEQPPNQVHRVQIPSEIRGNVTDGDPAAGQAQGEDGQPQPLGEDVFQFQVAQGQQVTISLNFQTGADFDLFLSDAKVWELDTWPGGDPFMERSAASDGTQENIRVELAPGTYYVFVDLWGGQANHAHAYTLSIR